MDSLRFPLLSDLGLIDVWPILLQERLLAKPTVVIQLQ